MDMKTAMLAMFLFMVTILVMAVGGIITKPDTIYEIRYAERIINTDNYSTVEGFVVVDDYYTNNILPPWHDHIQKPLTLQGNITITKR